MKNCNQCGKCCVKYGAEDLSASLQDITWWDHHNPDIYKYVSNGKIWIDPNNGKPVKRCPWLKKQANNTYTCEIYFDRPEDCRLYPSTVSEMFTDECEMLEAKDLNDLKAAQRQLDKLMHDSHKLS